MLYHISKYKLLTPMRPRIPKSKFEDQTTPRICFSTSIQGCLIGVNENKDISGEVYHVYGLETSNYITPSEEQVKDVDITGEVWVTEKCSPKHLYDIKVIGKKSEKTERINGKIFKVPVWDYEKIENIQESEVLDEGLIKRIGQHIKLKKKYGTFKYGDAYDKLKSSYRDAGMSRDDARAKTEDDLAEFDEISHPIKSKIKTFDMSPGDVTRVLKVAQNDTRSNKYKNITVPAKNKKGESLNIQFGHGASTSDQTTHKKAPRGGDNVDYVATCNPSGVGKLKAKSKHLGKGSHETTIRVVGHRDEQGTLPEYTNDGRVRVMVGAGSEKAFNRRNTRELKKINDSYDIVKISNSMINENIDKKSLQPTDKILKRFDPIGLKESVSHETSLSKQDILKILSTLGYNKSDYWISYKAALVLYGIVENTNDIDLCCNRKMMDSLEKDGYAIEKAPIGDIRKAIINDRIECFENNRRPTIKINGYNVETVDSILKLYKDMNREKDQKTIAAIEKHMGLNESEILGESTHNARIISGFAGTGANYAKEILKKKGYIVDTIDKYSNFYKIYPTYEKYIADIKSRAKKCDYLFIPYFLNMGERYIKNKIDFILVYPKRELKSMYLKRFKDLDFTPEQIQNFVDNWDDMITDCSTNYENAIALDKDEYLSDVIETDLKESELLDERLEVLVTRPKDFFKKELHLYRADRSSKNFDGVVRRTYLNGGTNLSSPRASSFWSDARTICIFYGLRHTLKNIFDIEYPEIDNKSQVFHNHLGLLTAYVKSDNDKKKILAKIKSTKMDNPFYVHEITIKGSDPDLGIGHNPSIREFTLDRDIVPDKSIMIDKWPEEYINSITWVTDPDEYLSLKERQDKSKTTVGAMERLVKHYYDGTWRTDNMNPKNLMKTDFFKNEFIDYVNSINTGGESIQLISDVHIGKNSNTYRDVLNDAYLFGESVQKVLDKHNPRYVVFLGDLVDKSKIEHFEEIFKTIMSAIDKYSAQRTKFIYILGNSEYNEKPMSIMFKAFQKKKNLAWAGYIIKTDKYVFTHAPIDSGDKICIHGHLHNSDKYFKADPEKCINISKINGVGNFVSIEDVLKNMHKNNGVLLDADPTGGKKNKVMTKLYREYDKELKESEVLDEGIPNKIYSLFGAIAYRISKLDDNVDLLKSGRITIEKVYRDDISFFEYVKTSALKHAKSFSDEGNEKMSIIYSILAYKVNNLRDNLIENFKKAKDTDDKRLVLINAQNKIDMLVDWIEGKKESIELELLDEQINSKTVLDKARDIMEKMNDIEYGSVYADGRKSKRDRDDWYDDSNKFCPQPVLSVLKHKMGHCIDQSELERYYFKKANIKHKVFSMFPERGSNMYHNHTFLVFFDENDTPYWFDHAWYSERGIHKGESLNELFKKICDKKRKADPQNDPENAERFKHINYEIFEVPQKSCLSWDDYVKWVWRQKLVYKG